MSGDMYNEGLKGVGPIPPAQGIYQMSATQMAPLGHRVAFSDGRVFRYAKAGGTDLVAGKVVTPSAINLDTNKNIETTSAIGSYEITVSTAAARTTSEGGFVCINDGTGQGLMYRIKTAVAGTTATSTNFTLYDPIATATVAGTDEAIILANPYLDLVLAHATIDAPTGISPIAVTAAYYFWVQTWGIAMVLCGSTAQTEGSMLTYSTTDGAVSTYAATATSLILTTPIIGYQYGAAAVDTEYFPIYLQITP